MPIPFTFAACRKKFEQFPKLSSKEKVAQALNESLHRQALRHSCTRDFTLPGEYIGSTELEKYYLLRWSPIYLFDKFFGELCPTNYHPVGCIEHQGNYYRLLFAENISWRDLVSADQVEVSFRKLAIDSEGFALVRPFKTTSF